MIFFPIFIYIIVSSLYIYIYIVETRFQEILFRSIFFNFHLISYKQNFLIILAKETKIIDDNNKNNNKKKNNKSLKIMKISNYRRKNCPFFSLNNIIKWQIIILRTKVTFPFILLHFA